MFSSNIEHLLTAYSLVAKTSMKDMPIVNEALRVEALGFRDWQDSEVGVLITPWFMNLLVVPKENNSIQMQVGKSVEMQLPAGVFSFLTQADEQIGIYLTSSLFSPMFDFADEAQARETASEVMEQIFNPPSESILQEEPTVSLMPKPRAQEVEPAQPAHSKPISRRDLLRGNLRAD